MKFNFKATRCLKINNAYFLFNYDISVKEKKYKLIDVC